MICPYCKKEFKPRAFGQKFCTRLCRKAHEHGFIRKTCIVCGKPFNVDKTRRQQLTCSKECHRLHVNAQNRVNAKKRTQNKLINQRPNTGTPAKNICHQCGKEFEPAYPTEKFCSDKCRFTFFKPELREALGNVFSKI